MGLRRRCGRTRQRTSAHSNIGKKLGCLEVIATLLEELLIAGSKIGLLRLLLHSTSGNLGLRALKASLLRRSANASNLLTSLHPAGKISGHNALLALCRLYSLLVALLVDGSQRLRGSKALLTSQLRPLKAGTLTKCSTRLDSLRLLLGTLLALLLLQCCISGCGNGLRIGVLIITNLILV